MSIAVASVGPNTLVTSAPAGWKAAATTFVRDAALNIFDNGGWDNTYDLFPELELG